MELTKSEIRKINSTKFRGVKLEFLSQTPNTITVKWRIFTITTTRARYVTGRIESIEDVLKRLEYKVNNKWNDHFKGDKRR